MKFEKVDWAPRAWIAALLLGTSLTVSAADAPLDMAKAKQTAETLCVGCHGADGNSPVPTYPKLAGQIPQYLVKQLREFKPDANGKQVRENAIMAGFASMLSDEDMQAIAAHFSAQTLQPAIAKDRELATVGQKLWRGGDASRGVPACAACHGPAGAGLPAQYPRLSGQSQEYTEDQLKKFRSGERANDAQSMMRSIAVKLTDPEIKALADYIAGLR